MIGFGLYYTDQTDAQEWQSIVDQMAARTQGHKDVAPTIVEFKTSSGDKTFGGLSYLNSNNSCQHSEDAQQCVFLNGQIYKNHNSLSANELLAIDDQEIENLRGQFVFLRFNKSTGNLKIIRDVGGSKTLFYWHSGKSLMASSNLRSIALSERYQKVKDVNKEGLWTALAYPAPPQPITVFKNIFCLLRGHSIAIRNGALRIEKYWSIPSFSAARNIDFNQAVEELNGLLKQSISYQIKYLSGITSTLSGGTDSTYLTNLAFQENKDLTAITFKLAGEQYEAINEDDVAAQLAQAIGVKHVIKSYDFESIFPHIDTLVNLYEQPGISLGAYFNIVEIAHEQQSGYLVNGLGGDELFGGFHFFKHLGYWEQLRSLRWLAQILPENRSKGIDKFKKIAGSRDIDEYYSRAFAMIMDWEISQLLPEESFDVYKIQQKQYNPDKKAFRDSVQGLMHYMFSNCPNHHLYRFETFSNHFGIQPIYPFLDRELIEFAFSIPSEYKVKGHKRKIVLKAAAKPYVPTEALTESKRGVGSPINSWIDNRLNDFKNEKLSSLKERELFSSTYINHLQKNLTPEYGKKIWKLVMTELWFEQYID